MSKRSQKPVKAAGSVPTGYGPLLAELKSRVRAALSVTGAIVQPVVGEFSQIGFHHRRPFHRAVKCLN